mgnify:CR=1
MDLEDLVVLVEPVVAQTQEPADKVVLVVPAELEELAETAETGVKPEAVELL